MLSITPCLKLIFGPLSVSERSNMSFEGEQLPVCMNHLVSTDIIEVVLRTY